MKKNKFIFFLIFVVTMHSCSNKKDLESLQNESSEKKMKVHFYFRVILMSFIQLNHKLMILKVKLLY